VTVFSSLLRWLRSAERPAARFEALIYFDGPITKWSRSGNKWKFFEQRGLRIPLFGATRSIMPRPDEREIVDRKEFRSTLAAQMWIHWRLKGFDTAKLVSEVRPL
jgi:hypothetical protein